MHRSLVVYTLACITLLLLSASTANACSCLDSGPPCQAFGQASAVFSGRVTEITSIRDDNNPHRGLSQRLVRFAIIQSYRGISGTAAQTITGSGGGDCGYPFKMGESYLVYAYQNSEAKKLYAGICSRTRPLSQASEDLKYMRSLSNSAAGATIYGVVSKRRRVNGDVPYEPAGPVAGVHITVEGNGGRVASLTNDKGEFQVTGLPEGAYNVLPTVPEGLWLSDGERKVELKDRGCALVNFNLESDTSLSGQVLEENGGPAAKITVDLVFRNQINERFQRDHLSAYADEEGRFEFRSIPPGEYLLGVRLSRLAQPTFSYPRTFYPGTGKLTQTQPITISEGQSLKGYNIQLPQKLTPRTFGGVVVWPDGSPVPNAILCFEEVEYAEGSLCFGGDAKVDEDGRFSFTGFEGLRYLVRAHVNVGNAAGQRHAEPVEVPANGNITDLKLVLTEPNGSCEKCREWRRRKSQ
jgi:hypothetical protein